MHIPDKNSSQDREGALDNHPGHKKKCRWKFTQTQGSLTGKYTRKENFPQKEILKTPSQPIQAGDLHCAASALSVENIMERKAS